jgi:hemolysin activation/secretion protein
VKIEYRGYLDEFNKNRRTSVLVLLISLIFSYLTIEPLTAQPVDRGPIPEPIFPPASPEQTPPPLLPSPEELLQPPTTPSIPPSQLPPSTGTITVDRFEFDGNTVFNPKELAVVTEKFTGKPITFAELLQAASAVTQLYIDQGYITSGAFIPAQQTFSAQGGTVKIQIVEGKLEAINVNGTGRLNPDYVRDRLAVATSQPLNKNRLLEALQLLQLNPLLSSISTELSAGSRPGLSVLDVEVGLARTFSFQPTLDNNQTPSVGSFRRGVQISEANLLGQGDGLNIAYFNTDGSNDLAISYTYPVNPYNGTVSLRYQPQWNTIVESPFNELDIQGNSFDLEFTFRQPIIQTPREELALGLTFTREESETSLLGFPFPLSPGANDQGQTFLSVLRFSQEYLLRSEQSILSARSQFSVGLNLFGATINSNPPDGQFFTWLGQVQYVNLLAPETLLLLRTNLQLADRPLVPLEQFTIGGPDTVRGYRQNLILANSGIIATAEVRVPILRVPEVSGLLQIAPFVDVGSSFDSDEGEEVAAIPDTLVSVGVGLQWQMGRNLSVRFDYGIPLISAPSVGNSWQEDGISFSVVISPF